MHVISTNIGKATTISWNGKEERTGIFKYPVPGPIRLERTDVAGDMVSDRKHHAGIHKACFLFSADLYPYWKERYPDLEWDWGMFGENLTVEGLDESIVRIGDVYSIGKALVQVSQPREPCYKLGVRFGNQSILKQYIALGRPGTYVRILKEGEVRTGDEIVLQEQSENTLTIQQFYKLLYAKEKSKEIMTIFMDNPSVPQYKKDRYRKYI